MSATIRQLIVKFLNKFRHLFVQATAWLSARIEKGIILVEKNMTQTKNKFNKHCVHYRF